MQTTALQIFNQTVQFEMDLIWVKPLCDFFNLHAKNQYLKIKTDPVLRSVVGKNRPDLGEIDTHGRILLSKKGFLRWIQTINPKTLDESLRESFVMYQEMIFDYLVGSAEEQKLIATLNVRRKFLKSEYNRIGLEIRQCNKDFAKAIDNRYQYSLPFETPQP